MSEIIKFCIQNGMIPFDILTGTLYKYVNIETAKLILKNSSLKFSTADEFNDPFELTLEGIDFRTSRDDVKALVNRNIKGNREARRRIFKEKVKNIHIAKDLLPQIMSEYKKSFGICCFSKKYDKTLM